jgi:hypothetical protein
VWAGSTALHGGRCAACYQAHTNFADESACLIAGSVWNKGKQITFGLLDCIMLHGEQRGSLFMICQQ